MKLELCRCGSKAQPFLEHIIGGIELYWYECTACHKFTQEARSEAAARQNWNDTQLGKLRFKKIIWDIGY